MDSLERSKAVVCEFCRRMTDYSKSQKGAADVHVSAFLPAAKLHTRY